MGIIYPLRVLRLPSLPASCVNDVDDSYFNKYPEVLFLSSQNLYNQLQSSEHNSTRLDLALARYYARMCTRSTPYGLLASCGIAPDHPELSVKEENIHYKVSLDYLALCQIVETIVSNKDVRPLLKIFPNSTIYKVFSEYRYVEYTFTNHKRNYCISSVEHTDVLEYVLNLCEKGIIYYKLIEKASSFFELNHEEVSSYIDTLLSEQVLTTGLEPTITGDGVLSIINEWVCSSITLIQDLKVSKDRWLSSVATSILYQLRDDLNLISRRCSRISTCVSNLVDEVKLLQRDLKNWGVKASGDKLVHIDTIRHASPVDNHGESYINTKFSNELKDLLRVLQLVSEGDVENRQLNQFAQRFYDKYEEQEVPLTQALDIDAGIGYLNQHAPTDSPLIDGISLDQPKNNSPILSQYKWKEKLLLEALYQGRTEVEITDMFLETFEKKNYVLPPSLAFFYRHVNNGKIHVGGASGTSAVNLINRFTPASPKIQAIVRDIVKEEESNNPDVVFAEILHLPENRTGNVMFHTGSRQYEIPYLAQSRLPRGQQIPISDLYLSWGDGQLQLRSKKLNKRVIPTLSTAYNFSLSELPIFRFLCDLQGSGCVSFLNFDWGPIKANARFLPRIRYRRFILSPASWRFDKQDLAHIKNAKDRQGRLRRFLQFHKKWALPHRFVYREGDQELFVDIDQSITIEAFWDKCRIGDKVLISEYYEPDAKTVRDENGNDYANQFLSFWINQQQSYQKLSERPATAPIQREHFPGDEWVYFKVYTSEQLQDTVLLSAINNAIGRLEDDHTIKRYFFIRYQDPYPHLRVRFLISEQKDFAKVVRIMNEEVKRLKEMGLVTSMQIDTYVREIERYPGDHMKLAESFFHADSSAALSILVTIADQHEDYRWLSCLLSVHYLLNDICLSINDRYELLSNLRDSFRAEFNINKATRLQIDKKYRKNREKIEAYLSLQAPSPISKQVGDILQMRTRACNTTVDQLMQLNKVHTSHTLKKILSSIIHMIINRLIPHDPRFHELLLYDFLCRHYRTIAAKNKLNVVITGKY